MKASKNFHVWEFVHSSVYDIYGTKSILFLDPKLIESIQDIRDFFGKPIIVNNYRSGGRLKNRGFRPPQSRVGAKYSQHKFGRAFDFHMIGMSAEELRREILKRPWKWPHIKRMENHVNWVHIDLANTGQKKIILFNP